MKSTSATRIAGSGLAKLRIPPEKFAHLAVIPEAGQIEDDREQDRSPIPRHSRQAAEDGPLAFGPGLKRGFNGALSMAYVFIDVTELYQQPRLGVEDWLDTFGQSCPVPCRAAP